MESLENIRFLRFGIRSATTSMCPSECRRPISSKGKKFYNEVENQVKCGDSGFTFKIFQLLKKHKDISQYINNVQIFDCKNHIDETIQEEFTDNVVGTRLH